MDNKTKLMIAGIVGVLLVGGLVWYFFIREEEPAETAPYTKVHSAYPVRTQSGRNDIPAGETDRVRYDIIMTGAGSR